MIPKSNLVANKRFLGSLIFRDGGGLQHGILISEAWPFIVWSTMKRTRVTVGARVGGLHHIRRGKRLSFRLSCRPLTERRWGLWGVGEIPVGLSGVSLHRSMELGVAGCAAPSADDEELGMELGVFDLRLWWASLLRTSRTWVSWTF